MLVSIVAFGRFKSWVRRQGEKRRITLRATRSRADDLVLGLRNQTVSIKSENKVLKNRNVMWIKVNDSGHITGKVTRGDARIDVVYAPGKGQWYTR